MNACRLIATKLCRVNANAQSFFSYRSSICGATVMVRQWTGGQILPTQRYLHVQTKNSAQTYSGNSNHRMDKVPEDFKLVYKNDLGPWYLAVRVGYVIFCSTLGIYFTLVSPLQLSSDLFSTDQGQKACFTAVWFLFSFPLFAFLTRTSPLRIYMHDSGQFISVRRTCFGRLKQLKYFAEDIQPMRKKPKKKGAEQEWEAINVYIHGKKVYLQSRYFLSPVYYNYHCVTSGFSRRDDSIMY